ncbi:MAG: pseudouridine synthase [Bacteroidales bacterium]|nr:pseudouridine synthase [Bacteroidales bacterium]
MKGKQMEEHYENAGRQSAQNTSGRNGNDAGYTSEGRRLRPRRKVGGEEERPRNYGDRPSRSNFSEHRSNYGPRPYGDRRAPSRSYSHHSGSDHEEGAPRRYGDRPSQGGYQGRPSRGTHDQQRNSYGAPRSYDRQGDRYPDRSGRPSEHKPWQKSADNGERRPYGYRGAQQGRGGFQRKPYGQKPYGRREDGMFNDNNETVNQMMNSSAQNINLSDNDQVATPIKEVERLNKYIANSGVCSRREADQFIQAGVVTVNGEVVTTLGTKINVLTDDVRFNGERLKGEEKIYIVMNKPKGYVTTASDPHADRTVMELLKGCTSRVFPVGRLDKNTTGVLMFTNDGDIAEKLTHPSYDKKKIYQVILDHNLKEEDHDKIMAGIELNDGTIAADELEYIDENDHRKLGIKIHSGRNRIVRRIFESLGYDVRALDRVYFAGLTKKGLQKGEWRYLTQGEINILKMGAYM